MAAWALPCLCDPKLESTLCPHFLSHTCQAKAPPPGLPVNVPPTPIYLFRPLGSSFDLLTAFWLLSRIIFLLGTTYHLYGYDIYSPKRNAYPRPGENRMPSTCSYPESKRSYYHHLPQNWGQERMAFSITGCAYGNNANNSSLTLNTEVNFTGLEDLVYVKI